MQRFWLDNFGNLITVLVDDGGSFVTEEVTNGLAGVVEYTHGSKKTVNPGERIEMDVTGGEPSNSESRGLGEVESQTH